jgi:NAD(P)-dependent dehydrogenase (short-subunit alcohol dehydrogenase family)
VVSDGTAAVPSSDCGICGSGALARAKIQDRAGDDLVGADVAALGLALAAAELTFDADLSALLERPGNRHLTCLRKSSASTCWGRLSRCRQISPTRTQGGGSIVNINSGTAFMTIPEYSGYSSSKRALVGFSLAARAELAKDHIVVSEV